MASESMIGCAYKRGMLKREHAEKYIPKFASKMVITKYGYNIPPEKFVKMRNQTFRFPMLRTYEQNLEKFLLKAGGCSAIINYEIPQILIQTIQKLEGGYSYQAPLHEVLEGTPFEW